MNSWVIVQLVDLIYNLKEGQLCRKNQRIQVTDIHEIIKITSHSFPYMNIVL